jgi:hypothetical protein
LIIALFAIGVIIMFKGCSKDKEFFDQELTYRSDYHGLIGDILEHYNWFAAKKSALNSGSSDSRITPFSLMWIGTLGLISITLDLTQECIMLKMILMIFHYTLGYR